jgi:thioredoxin reductase (NADPH)
VKTLAEYTLLSKILNKLEILPPNLYPHISLMYDVLIIGLGCAGYTAAIYASRYKLTSFIVGAEEGGLGMTAAEVGNWPGIEHITGPDLMENFKKHALSFEQVTHKIARVEKIEKTAAGFALHLDDGQIVEGKTLIFAMGSNKRHLGAPGEEKFSGKGVTYCATCDAFFYRNKTVAVIGGGDSAVEGAAIAAQVAAKVYLIHRRDAFRAEPYWVDQVKSKSNVSFVLNTNVLEIQGDQKVRSIKLDQPFEGSDTLAVDGVFIEIGANPATALAQSIGCQVDEKGFLQVDAAQRTTVPGVFGAGDITSASNRFAQFTTAAGEASTAANSVFNYLQSGH